MATKRTFIALTAAALLAACSNITQIERAQKETGPLKLSAVVVDVSSLDVATEGRGIERTTSQLQNDLRAAIAREAAPYSVAEGLPANINVKVEKVFLANLLSRVTAGTSFIESVASVTDAETGAAIVEPVRVKATAEQLRGPGPVGVASTIANSSVEADYQGAIDAYARALIASLLASQ